MIFCLLKSIVSIIIHVMNHDVAMHIRAIRRVIRYALADYKRSVPADDAAQDAVNHYRLLLVRDAECLRRQAKKNAGERQ